MTSLAGKRVLVTRAKAQAESAAALLRDRGAEPVVIPTLEIHEPDDRAPLDRALASMRDGAYDWVAFTSANAVERTVSSADAVIFARTKLAAVGPGTARALEALGLRPDVVAEDLRGEGLAAAMLAVIPRRDGESARVLLPRAKKARDALPDALRAAGCTVDVVVAYETRPPSDARQAELRALLDGGAVDAVVFTSSSTVENLVAALGTSESMSAAARLRGVVVASIGPLTSETAVRAGIRVDVTADTSTVAGLVDALDRFFAGGGLVRRE